MNSESNKWEKYEDYKKHLQSLNLPYDIYYDLIKAYEKRHNL